MGLFNNLFGKKSKEHKTQIPPEAGVDKTRVGSEETEVNETDLDRQIKFTIDNKECIGHPNQNILDAAIENGIFIPSLCHMKGVNPAGSCRVCSVRVNGRPMTACTTPIADGMEVENDQEDLQEMRKAIIELLFVEGNHFCPACEKSGNCELQALGYKYQMMAPRFPYSFNPREVNANTPKLIMDDNRCIRCKRCVRTIRDDQGRSIFAMNKRGHNVQIVIDEELAATMSDEQAMEAMNNCPVGAILKKEKGFDQPIGSRKFDHTPIDVVKLKK